VLARLNGKGILARQDHRRATIVESTGLISSREAPAPKAEPEKSYRKGCFCIFSEHLEVLYYFYSDLGLTAYLTKRISDEEEIATKQCS